MSCSSTARLLANGPAARITSHPGKTRTSKPAPRAVPRAASRGWPPSSGTATNSAGQGCAPAGALGSTAAAARAEAPGHDVRPGAPPGRRVSSGTEWRSARSRRVTTGRGPQETLECRTAGSAGRSRQTVRATRSRPGPRGARPVREWELPRSPPQAPPRRVLPRAEARRSGDGGEVIGEPLVRAGDDEDERETGDGDGHERDEGAFTPPPEHATADERERQEQSEDGTATTRKAPEGPNRHSGRTVRETTLSSASTPTANLSASRRSASTTGIRASPTSSTGTAA